MTMSVAVGCHGYRLTRPCFVGSTSVVHVIANYFKDENEEGEKSLWDVVLSGPQEAFDMIMDPNKKEREEEEKIRKDVKIAKKTWRAIRKERFGFLDNCTTDEKKVDE